MGILETIFQKKGIKSVNDLSQEERETFENYQKILDKDELTIEDFKKFLQQQISIIETRWKDLELSAQRKGELVPYHTAYRTLLQAIDAPKMEKIQLENLLNSMLQ